MNSVQKNSKIRNFCTEFLHFARSAKITAFYMAKSPVFVFFLEKIAFLIQQNSPRNSPSTTLGSMFQIEEKCHVQYDPESCGDRSCKTDIGETGIRLDTHVISEGKTDT